MKYKNLKERIEEKIERIPECGCWIWMGSSSKINGYGYFGVGNKKIKNSHRAVWELFKGEIPNGMMVLHHCDTPSCVNPYHLFLGTQKDNVQDCVKKNRFKNVSRKKTREA